MWVDVASANLQDSNHPRLARAPRRGLRGQTSQVLPTIIASRAVRRRPASRFFPRPVHCDIKPSARQRPPQAARRSDAPLLLLDPLSQSCDVSDDDAAVIGVDQASPFEGAEHQCDGFPSRAYVARNLLMSELHTNQDSP